MSPDERGPGAAPAEVLAELRRFCTDELRLGRCPEASDELVRDLELDSVTLLSLVVALEDHFQVALDEEDAAEIRTVADLAALVALRSAREARP